jgi:hypothetical protein
MVIGIVTRFPFASLTVRIVVPPVCAVTVTTALPAPELTSVAVATSGREFTSVNAPAYPASTIEIVCDRFTLAPIRIARRVSLAASLLGCAEAGDGAPPRVPIAVKRRLRELACRPAGGAVTLIVAEAVDP